MDDYYLKFLHIVNEENYKPYYSNLGLQGSIFGNFNKTGFLKPGQNFNNYKAILSVISAVIFTFLIIWVISNFGYIIGLSGFFFILQIDWLTVSASHFFWFSGLMFAAFVFNLFFIKKIERWKPDYINLLLLFIGNLIFSFSKCLSSGFEVIPTFLIMSTLPVFYYSIRFKYSIKLFTLLFVLVSGALLIGAASTMLIQAQKIDKVEMRSGAGFEHLISSYARRTSGSQKIRMNMRPKIKRSYTITAFEVVKMYWHSDIGKINVMNNKLEIKSSFFTYSLLLISMISILLYNRFSRHFFAILITSWISILAPLSMFLLFKSLSFLHPHLVPITWNMPFTILVFLTLFYGLKKLFFNVSFPEM